MDLFEYNAEYICLGKNTISLRSAFIQLNIKSYQQVCYTATEVNNNMLYFNSHSLIQSMQSMAQVTKSSTMPNMTAGLFKGD